MKIEQNKNILNPLMNIEGTNQTSPAQSTRKVESSSVNKQALHVENNASTSSVKISSEGKLIQAIDDTSDKIDSILERHLTVDQKKNLDDIYKELDTLFSKGKLSKEQEKSAEILLEQADKIYNTSIEKLSEKEHKTVGELSDKIEKLSEKLSNIENSDDGASGTETTSKSNESGGSEKSDGETSTKKSELADTIKKKGKAKKKNLTVAELNALSVAELNKLPPHQLKKLNAKQLNKLNANLLNTLALPQLQKLSKSNIEKLNQAQRDKLQ